MEAGRLTGRLDLGYREEPDGSLSRFVEPAADPVVPSTVAAKTIEDGRPIDAHLTEIANRPKGLRAERSASLTGC
jgi:hypothetical protein